MGVAYPIKVLSKNIIVNETGQILALKRSKSDDRRPNCWDFPGGGKDASEDIYESAVREIYEEAGLQVLTEDLQVIYIESGMGVTQEDVLAICFVANKWTGEVTLSLEHSAYEWVTPQEFLQMETGNDGGFLHACVKRLALVP